MKRIIFFSWQSDSPNSTNRGFIQQALEKAASAIASDASIEVEPVVDRDTEGVAGAPDIASTILAKISASDVVVADVTIIGTAGARATPNPNVLIELGYALKAVGHERVILVLNEAFGRIEDLPFDLRARRVVRYSALAGSDKAAERKALEKTLDRAVRAALSTVPSVSEPRVSMPSIRAIEEGKANKKLLVRSDLEGIFHSIETAAPPSVTKGLTVPRFLQAIDRSQEPIADFSRLVTIIAALNESELALEVYRWFGKVFERYDLSENHQGIINTADFDYFKFVGHELFVTLVAALMAERRWALLHDLLHAPIPVRYLRRTHGPGTASWEFASQAVRILTTESERLGRILYHADLLHDRHTKGGLATAMPFHDFMSADFFLFLRGELARDRAEEHRRTIWRPWSCVYLEMTPLFIQEAERKAQAQELANALDVGSIEELRGGVLKEVPGMSRLFGSHWDYSLDHEAIRRIGTRA